MVLFALACTSADSAAPVDTGSPTTTAVNICGDTAQPDTYSAGMSRAGDGGVYTVALMDALPSPPDKGDNTWTIAVSSASDGARLTGAEVSIAPFMPEHGHGTNPATVPTAETDAMDGTYVSDPFDLFMGGFWELTISVSGAAPDQAKFSFCIEG